jgi:hypothetical protein
VTLEKIIARARKLDRINGGLVLCGNCDNPASKSISLRLGWTCCAPCALGEADSFDSNDLIPAPEVTQEIRHKAKAEGRS